MSSPFPLSPGQAVAVAAVLDAHPRRLPHWRGWADDLRTWAAANDVDDDEAPAPVVGVQVSRAIVDDPGGVDLIAALRQAVEAAKARREAIR